LVMLRGAVASDEVPPVLVNPVDLIRELTVPASRQPANASRLRRRLGGQYAANASAGYRAARRLAPMLNDTLATATANARVTLDAPIEVYALRLEASLFGHNVPKRTSIASDGSVTIEGDWPVIESQGEFGDPIPHEEERAVHLDARYDQVAPGGWVVVAVPDTRLTDATTLIGRAGEVSQSVTRSEYGVSGPTTRIALGQRWINLEDMAPSTRADDDFDAIRSTVVYAQPEELTLAEEPVGDPVCGGVSDAIELDGFYEDLEAGRWVVVSGERDIEGTSGVRVSELAMIGSVTQATGPAVVTTFSEDGVAAPARAGESIHTFITLAEELAYCFRRDTVTIHGNVVNATHGETRREVLGSGDGASALQVFDLKQKPLTFVSAPNPSGVDSSLKVFVNDLEWHEAPGLAALGPRDRMFTTQTDSGDTTSVVFGNGVNGARLPTGVENVKAEYRAGIGKAGNVKAGQITLLHTKPLGVTEVVNPLRASGGADRESRDQARTNAPLAVRALDRLVSVADYEDFSRTYAGIGKSSAVELSDGRRQLVHVTIAGVDDSPIELTSDLFRNLRRSLFEFGDPRQAIELAVRELLLIVVSANVRLLPGYRWAIVEHAVRCALLDALGFARRELGQDVP
ncbi:MAG: putative baseplate assembly protein, partial [Pseudomonadota bacterium]